MRGFFFKMLFLASFALVGGVKALIFFSSSEALFTQTFHTTADQVDKLASRSSPKPSFSPSVFVEDDTFTERTLEKEFVLFLRKAFAPFAKYDLSFRMMAFIKLHMQQFAVRVHGTPLYVLDRELLI